ncbi:hypothetical protein Aperf_G00000033037 [Anoplocephala perfoliata]
MRSIATAACGAAVPPPPWLSTSRLLPRAHLFIPPIALLSGDICELRATTSSNCIATSIMPVCVLLLRANAQSLAHIHGIASTLTPSSDYLSLKSRVSQFNSASSSKNSSKGSTYLGSGFSNHSSLGVRSHKMPVCHGVQSFVMASRAPVFHACSVDLSWQTTVHACQRCPRAALTPSAAIAAIATQSNMEGTTSRFCPAGVHMGKCLPAQDVYTDAWGTASNISGSGLVSRLSQKFGEGSKNLDASIPPSSFIEPWVPPDLPLPKTVHSKASFSPSVPISVQSPLPDDKIPSPSVKTQKVTPSKFKEDKESKTTPQAPESTENKVAEPKKPAITKAGESEVSLPKTPPFEPSPPPSTTEPQKEGITVIKATEKAIPKDANKTPAAIPTEKTEHANGSPTAPSTVTPTPTLAPPSREAVDKGLAISGKDSLSPQDEAPHALSTISSTSPVHFEEHTEESKENVPKVSPQEAAKVEKKEENEENRKPDNAEKTLSNQVTGDKVTNKTPSGAALKPLWPSKRVPQFYIPMGRSTLTASELSAQMEKTQAQILEALAAPPPPQKKPGEGESSDAKSVESEPVSTEKPTVDSPVPFGRFGIITKAFGCPLYWKRAIYMAAGGDADSNSVPVSSILSLWRRVLEKCPDPASQFVYLLTKGKSQYLVPDDFWPIIQDVVDTHPSLTFLQAAPEFHARYVTTVVSRIFFCTNTSWSGRISLGELRRSNFLDVLASLETEEDINLVTQYFSYEHFYVIYCKFWELDTNHDLIISKADLARHNNYAISERMIDRIFSGAVTRGTSFKEGTMTYSDFVWFLLAEEDKRHPRSIEYWFRCMDLDGDGVLSLYELEYFYSEQSARMEEMGIEPPTLEDCLCQCLDMVRPAVPDKIRLSDLKKCNLCSVFFDTFFNLPKYLQHEQRDPFANLRDIEEGLTEISDWDRYASDTYEMLIASESGGGGGGGEDGDDEEEDEDDEDMATSSPVLSAAAAAAAEASAASEKLAETSSASKESSEPPSAQSNATAAVAETAVESA